MSLQQSKDVLTPQMETIKEKYFPDHDQENPVILHRREIIQRLNSFSTLRDQETNNHWEVDLLSLLKVTDFKCISAVLDKAAYKKKYGSSAHHPYLLIMNIILERYIKFLQDNRTIGDVMAESRGGPEDLKMKYEYKRLWDTGTFYTPAFLFQKYLTSSEIKIKNKQMNVAGLQLADLICHPIKYQILRVYKKCEDKSGDYAKKVCELLKKENKYFKSMDRSGTERVFGFGLKLLN